jgi:flagellin
VDRIANVTEFNGTKLTDGSTASIDVQVGIHNTADDSITLALGDLSAATLGVDTASIDMSTASGASTALTGIDAAIDMVSGYRASYGASENRLGNALNNLETFEQSTSEAESRIRDADFGKETAQLSQNQILQQAGVSVLSQAKGINQSALTLLQG